jgi:energy-converting hydrogenase Eha subunit C
MSAASMGVMGMPSSVLRRRPAQKAHVVVLYTSGVVQLGCAIVLVLRRRPAQKAHVVVQLIALAGTEKKVRRV